MRRLQLHTLGRSKAMTVWRLWTPFGPKKTA